ncbi:MAG TPA: 3-hydroxyacyl-CoA dehydrogenase NAD-binding domain-containing protein, partial [Burkholderiaceae bacterium]|nr:3-hydroxyacyl-CoA dehydrogenase NAD-binding domain-containing protein [Burkholderiaceae bacterium]
MATISTRLEPGGGATVAVLTIDNPPVNAMNRAVRAELRDALRAATADPDVAAVVLIGAGGKFIAGADIREFGKPIAGGLSGRDVIAAIEACADAGKPVVAALGGNALGGGLEVALGCPFRVATSDCALGLPEVNLGLLPGAGGTQRLPRLVGAARALEMIVGGKPVGARQALEIGLIDELVEGDLLDGALAYTRRMLAARAPLRRVADRGDRVAATDPAVFSDIRERNAAKWRGVLAPWRIVDCIEAACTRPFADGYALELAAFEECKASAQRAALVHLFIAEREAARIPGLPADLKPGLVRRAAVVGAGTMGAGIAMCFANAGIPVHLLDADEKGLARGRELIEKNYATSVARGSLSREKMDRALAQLTFTLDYGAIGAADIVVEAAFEDMGVKKDVFARLDAVMQPDAILATNTSTLDIDQIAAATARPASVIGAHFFSPANVMKLL